MLISATPNADCVPGCYECSQRRIHCDRGEPSCAKCIAKDIPCSGLGIRYRFNDDVIAKFRTGEKRKSGGPYQPNVTCDDRIGELKSDHPTQNSADYDHVPVYSDVYDEESDLQMASSSNFHVPTAEDLTEVLEDDAVGASEQTSIISNRQTSWANATGQWLIPQALNDASDPWKRHLLLYCRNYRTLMFRE